MKIARGVGIREFIGDAHFALGTESESARAYEEAASRAAQAGLIVARVSALASLIRPLAFSHPIDPDRGLAALDEAVEVSKTFWGPAAHSSHSDASEQFPINTTDPHLQALAWEMKTRVAMAQNDWVAAGKYIEQALTMVEKFQVPVAAWQVHATAWRLCQQVNENGKAEMHRARAEAYIRTLADSFAPDEPLRGVFLAAGPVSRILNKTVYACAPRTQFTRATPLSFR
jgi:hypothetical protein